MGMDQYKSGMAGLALACGTLTGCPKPQPPPPPPDQVAICDAPQHIDVAVMEFDDETGSGLQLGGVDDVLSTAMIDTGCFGLLERAKLEVIKEELRLCADSNEDKHLWDCAEADAQKDEGQGTLKVANAIVFGELTFFEPRIEGTELRLKIPEIGNIGGSIEYTALAFTIRAVDAKTGRKLGQIDLHTVIKTSEAGIDVEAKGFKLGAGGFSKTRLGVEFTEMMRRGAKKLHEQLEAKLPTETSST